MEKFDYASFWGRFGAWMADQLITAPAYYILMILIAAAYPESDQAEVEVGVFALATALYWIYFAGFNSSSWQATPGKRLFGYKVVDLNGNQIDFAVATKQHFATILSTIPLFFGFLMIFWTKRRQGLHDILAKTVVIKRHESE